VIIIGLITVTELREESLLPLRDFDLSDYTDAQLQKKIDWATAYIQKESKRYFTETEFTQSEIGYYGSAIFLENTPVTEITNFTIGGANIDADTYNLHSETGMIEFTNDEPYTFDYSVTYNVYEDVDSDIYLEAQDICMDLVFVKLQTPTDGQDIKSFKDADFSVSYEQDSPMDNINKRISIIRKSELITIVED